jgi:MFS family permease
MGRVAELVAPARMGRSFRWLLASSWVSNLGDGIVLSAGPLLVASLTRSPMLVALTAIAQRLPWLLLGLYAGAVADRIDRRRLVIAADTARAVVLAVLCLSIATDQVTIGIVLVAMLALGICEVFADTTSSTLLPMLVGPKDLGLGNARLQSSYLLANQIIGPPIGAFLFAVGMLWPFAAQLLLVAAAVVLVARIATPAGGVRGTPDTSVLRDIRHGIRWVVRSDPVRTLGLIIVAFNITWGAAWSVLVLYALDHLRMGELGFGLLTTAAAVGGLASTAAYARIERRFDLATVMRTCLLLEVLTHLSLALARRGWVALLIMVVFGAYAFVWAAVSTTVRQRATPTHLQGRVASVYMVGLFGGLIVGQALGGVIASRWGLTAPFWFAFVGAGLTLALVWNQLDHIAHAQAPPQGDETAGPIES